jgi:hypothetical protein
MELWGIKLDKLDEKIDKLKEGFTDFANFIYSPDGS